MSRQKSTFSSFDNLNEFIQSEELIKQAEREKDDFITKVPYTIEKEYIPEDPQLFYEDFGFLIHPRTKQPIKKLTPYQYKIWNSKAKILLVPKPQKSGVTTTVSLQDFHTVLLPDGMGKDVLIVGQTLKQGIEHVYTLKRLIADSEKYRKYLITNSKELFFKEEKTKMGVIYIKNPDNPFRPSRIIATPFSVQGLWSWKNVCRIHMSDVAAAEVVDDIPIYDAAGTRFANTEGNWVIESPPNGVKNYYYTLYEEYKNNPPDAKEQVIVVDVNEAIEYGVVTKEFIESEKKRLGYRWFQFYGSQFIEASGNLFNLVSIDRAEKLGAQLYNPYNYSLHTAKFILADQGYSSSKFVILILEWDNKLKKIKVLHGEELDSPLFEQARDRILELRKIYGNVLNIGIDCTSRMEFAMSIKKRIGENYHWPSVKQKLQELKTKNIRPEKRMIVVPFLFNTESKLEMSAHTQEILDDNRELVIIHPKFDKLIASLKGAIFDDNGLLDKDQSPHNDWLDCFMMGLMFFGDRRKQ